MKYVFSLEDSTKILIFLHVKHFSQDTAEFPYKLFSKL